MIALYFKIKGERQIPFGEQLKAGFSPHPRIHMFSPAAGFHFVYVCAVTGESHVPCVGRSPESHQDLGKLGCFGRWGQQW